MKKKLALALLPPCSNFTIFYLGLWVATSDSTIKHWSFPNRIMSMSADHHMQNNTGINIFASFSAIVYFL